MESSTTRRWLAVLTFGLVSASMAFVVGARAGAALNVHVNGLTMAHDAIPHIEVAP